MAQINKNYIFSYSSLLLIAIAIDTILTPISLIAGHMGIPLAWHFFKIPFLMVFAIAFLKSISNGINLTPFNILFITIGFIAIIVGLSRGQLNTAFFAHTYHFILAVTCFSLGRALDLNLLKKLILRSFNFLTVYALILSIIYYQCYRFGIIGYWGISSNFGYIAVVLLATNRFKQSLFMIISIILTGKRTVLAGTFITGIILSLFRRQRLHKTIAPLLLFFVIGVIGFYAGFLSRFSSAFELEDKTRFWYVLTSGRNFEIIYALQEFKTILDWIIGFGYGMSFEIPIGPEDLDKTYILHYTHFSPTSMLLLYGSFFTSVLYIIFCNMSWKAIKFSSGEFGLFCALYLYAFITSFAGATIFVDGKFWLLLGIISQINYLNNSPKKNVLQKN